MEQQASTPQLKEHSFEFKGAGGEYFKIWIVNILLTIITLGIYSAWAKVRTTRYFYGNTFLNETSFEYLANPVAILKGRLIAVAFFILYSFLSGVSPMFGGLLLLFLFLVSPYIVVRALRFHHRMSAYKNIRFDFVGSVKDAAVIYLLWPLLSIFSFGLLYPLFHQRFIKFYIGNTRYGKESFKSTAAVGEFYKIYLILFAIGVVVYVAAAAVAMTAVDLSALRDTTLSEEQKIAVLLPLLATIYGALILFSFFAMAFLKAMLTNLVMNTMSVSDRFHFNSNLSVGAVTWIMFTNLLAITFSLGLAYPWAKVRLARYTANHTELTTRESMDAFLGQHVDETSAIGEEVGDMFDIGTAAI